ncbi:MAG: ATP-binding cassette domain-containing protein, partial [Promethearchaeota archaeon]
MIGKEKQPEVGVTSEDVTFSNDLQLIVKDVYKTYHTGTIEVPACRGINLSAKRGAFRLILGPSGCGKTTILNLLGGLDTADSGHIWVNYGTDEPDFRDITALSHSELTMYRREKVGIIFQFYNLIPILTA